MKLIKLKIKKKYLEKIRCGVKTAELRIDDDKNFEVGDYLELNCLEDNSTLLVKITYILDCIEIDQTCDPRLKMICFN